MRVFVFGSDNATNVWAGVGAQTCAVLESAHEPTNKGFRTKAEKMPGGAFGLLYDSERKCFTTPFVVHSPAKLGEKVSNVWRGTWILPFGIRTLGNPHAILGWDDAKKILPSCLAGMPLNRLLNVEPLTVFVANEVSDGDWAQLIEKLAN